MNALLAYYWHDYRQRRQTWWRLMTANPRQWLPVLSIVTVTGILVAVMSWLPLLAVQLPATEGLSPEQRGLLYQQLVVVVALTAGFLYATYLAARDLYGAGVPMVARSAPGGSYFWWLRASRIVIQALLPMAVSLVPVGVILKVVFKTRVVEMGEIGGLLLLAAAGAATSGILLVAVVRLLSRVVRPATRGRYQQMLLLSGAGAGVVVGTIPLGYGLLSGQPAIPLAWVEGGGAGLGLALFWLGIGGVVGWLWWRDASRLSDVTSFIQARGQASEWSGTFLSWSWPKLPRLILLQVELLRVVRDAQWWLRNVFLISVWVVVGVVGHYAILTSEIPYATGWRYLFLLLVSAWAVADVTRQFIAGRPSEQWWRPAILATPASPAWWREVKVAMATAITVAALACVLLGWWLCGVWAEGEWVLGGLLFVQSVGVSLVVAWLATRDHQRYVAPAVTE